MSKSTSVAPKERINIKYVPATGDQVEEKELPLNLVIVGDHKGRAEDNSIEERQLVSINKGPMGNIKAFREAIANVLTDEVSRKNLLDELKLSENE